MNSKCIQCSPCRRHIREKKSYWSIYNIYSFKRKRKKSPNLTDAKLFGAAYGGKCAIIMRFKKKFWLGRTNKLICLQLNFIIRTAWFYFFEKVYRFLTVLAVMFWKMQWKGSLLILFCSERFFSNAFNPQPYLYTNCASKHVFSKPCRHLYISRKQFILFFFLKEFSFTCVTTMLSV